MAPPIFYYDFSSPYAYLAAARVDDVLPVKPEWRPIAFGVIVQDTGKVPWSFRPDRDVKLWEIDARAVARGMAALRYPDGWPRETYSLAPLRAALLARDQAELRAVSHELYRTAFVNGQHFQDVETVLDSVERAGLDRERVRAGLQDPETKERLRTSTAEALAQGVDGVPTVVVGQQLFWGDDQLEAAASAIDAASASEAG